MANKAINRPIKATNNRSGNPEIMENQDVDIQNNEIDILLDQIEAEQINEAIKLNI